MDRASKIAQNLKTIQAEIGSAQLVAVTKYSPIEDIKSAYQAGQRDFGENKVQDLVEKSKALEKSCPDICWHFIGHLQSNKVSKLLEVYGLKYIHSIDSQKLLETLFNKAKNHKTDLSFFLQMNTSGEKEKGGFENTQELERALEYIHSQTNPHLKFIGLMTMGTYRTDEFEAEARRCFSALLGLKSNFLGPLFKLSMGMSSDYKIALEYKSDFVRIGSAIFKG